MIRIPFSSSTPEARFVPERSPSILRQDGTPASEEERVQMIEARLATLELKLVTHAEELKVQVSERVMRIQSRLENAMKFFQSSSPGEDNEGDYSEEAGNVLEFSADLTHLHHLHAANAREAINELNQTIRLTREHLEALAGSVERMRQAVASR